MSDQFVISRASEDESSAAVNSLVIVVAVLATLFVISLIVHVVCVIFIFVLLGKLRNSVR